MMMSVPFSAHCCCYVMRKKILSYVLRDWVGKGIGVAMPFRNVRSF